MTVLGAIYKAYNYKKANLNPLDSPNKIFENNLDYNIIPGHLVDLLREDCQIMYKDTICKLHENSDNPNNSKIVLIIDPMDSSYLVFYDYIFGCEVCPNFTLIRVNIRYGYPGKMPESISIIERELSWQEYLTFQKSEGGENNSEKK